MRSIFERFNKEIIAAIELAKEAGEDSEIAKRGNEFSGKLILQGATLSKIANGKIGSFKVEDTQIIGLGSKRIQTLKVL